MMRSARCGGVDTMTAAPGHRNTIQLLCFILEAVSLQRQNCILDACLLFYNLVLYIFKKCRRMSPDTQYAHVFFCLCNVHVFICKAVILPFFSQGWSQITGYASPSSSFSRLLLLVVAVVSD